MSALVAWAALAAFVFGAPVAWSEPAPDARLQEVDPILRELERTSGRYANVPRTHGAFLRMLIEMSGAESVLEVGTSNGYSAIWIGLGLEETGGKLTTIEIVPEKAEEARQNTGKAGLEDIVTCVTGDALETIPRLEDTYDFVFLDAVKQDYWRYFELVRPKLRDGAIVVGHNAISARRSMSKYFEILDADSNIQTTIVAIDPRDGFAVSYVREAAR
jgi:predicted O-methyltransferase YrrM